MYNDRECVSVGCKTITEPRVDSISIANRELEACYISRMERHEYYSTIQNLLLRAEVIDRNLHDLYFFYPKSMLESLIEIVSTVSMYCAALST